MISPTPGRIVWYTPTRAEATGGHFNWTDQTQPCAAMVVRVFGDTMVNLTVFDQNGHPHPRTSIPLLQDDVEPLYTGGFCQWMPYQKGQAAKTEAAEKDALTLGAEARAQGRTGY